jgi:hypothetical protein
LLDGDISKRSLTYVSNIGDYYMIENNKAKSTKHFIFHDNKNNFDNLLTKDIKENKKIVIVSMSSEIAHTYYELYKNKYSVCLHTSKTDDELFDKLKDVNSYWSQFNIVIYSPTIESGVDFNLEYFDSMYCILCSNSTSQRGFMQMSNRIRKLKNNNVNIFLNGLKHNDKVYEYSYSEVNTYFNTILKLFWIFVLVFIYTWLVCLNIVDWIKIISIFYLREGIRGLRLKTLKLIIIFC